MPDWTKSMKQTFEYYIVDPGTWKDSSKLENVISSTISRDSEAETLGSATIDVIESIGEAYVRIYLVTEQDELVEKHCLGTFLVQTPSMKYDGKMKTVSMEAYTPLLELKDSNPPIGYSILEGANIMRNAYMIIRERIRPPVVETECSETLYRDFVSDTSETWISFLSDLISNANYEFALDEMGRILFAPVQEISSLQPIWTYDDDNSSILYSEVTVDHDLYGIPNVVEVVYSNGNYSYCGRAVNDDENSPISTVNRGREIVYRDTSPNLTGDPTAYQIDKYAERLLKAMSSVEYTISYSHGYCPVRLGDCVRLNYKRAGLTDIKAKVVSQSIKCEAGCKVTEKAVFTKKLWG